MMNPKNFMSMASQDLQKEGGLIAPPPGTLKSPYRPVGIGLMTCLQAGFIGDLPARFYIRHDCRQVSDSQINVIYHSTRDEAHEYLPVFLMTCQQADLINDRLQAGFDNDLPSGSFDEYSAYFLLTVPHVS